MRSFLLNRSHNLVKWNKQNFFFLSFLEEINEKLKLLKSYLLFTCFENAQKFYVSLCSFKINMMIVNIISKDNFLSVLKIVVWSRCWVFVLIFDFWSKRICLCWRLSSFLLRYVLLISSFDKLNTWKYLHYSWNRYRHFLLIK